MMDVVVEVIVATEGGRLGYDCDPPKTKKIIFDKGEKK